VRRWSNLPPGSDAGPSDTTSRAGMDTKRYLRSVAHSTYTRVHVGYSPCALLLGLLLSLGCAGGAPAPLLRVGTSGDYAPFSREGRGFDVEIAQRFAAESGYRIEWVPFEWPSLTQSVREGRFDVAMSGVTWRPERAVVGRMSRAVAAGGPCLLGILDGRRVGVNRGGVLERFAREQLSERQIVAVADNLSLPQLLSSGAVDVILTDSFELESFRAAVQVEVAGQSARALAVEAEVRCWPAADRKVFWVTPGRVADLAPQLDAWLARHEAELRELRRRWFGAEQSRDGLDHLIDLLARRLAFMPAVGAFKRVNTRPIEDPERERLVLERVRVHAAELSLPVEPVVALFERQIAWAKELQRRTSAPQSLDLTTEIRPALLRLGDEILEAIRTLLDADTLDAETVGALRALDPEDARLAPLTAWLLPHEMRELCERLRALDAAESQSRAGSWAFGGTF